MSVGFRSLPEEVAERSRIHNELKHLVWEGIEETGERLSREAVNTATGSPELSGGVVVKGGSRCSLRYHRAPTRLL
jgi:hypothetical protein